MAKIKEKLLILDDEGLILRSLEFLFQNNYEVFTADDAATGLRLAAEQDISVILCDRLMPGMGGHEFLRRAGEVSMAARILMSGFSDMRALTEAVNNGHIFAYVAKPWDPAKLRAQVSAAVVHFKLTQEVEHERGLLRALMESVPDLIYFKDLQSRFTRVNEAHARNLGASSAAECIGKSNADYFDSAYSDRWRLQEEEIVRSGLPQIDEIQQLHNPRGGPDWWSTTKVPMFDRSGRVSGIAGISRDITALKKTEEMLREQSEHNRMILETATDAFIGMGPDGAITVWNPQAERTFGWTASEVLGRRLSETVIPNAHHRGYVLNEPVELMALHRDGHEFPVEATIWPVRTGGDYSYNAFVHDITERKRAEQAGRKERNLVQLLQSMTVAANRSSSIEHTAQVCLERICSYTGWPIGHVYLRSNSLPDRLVSTELWHTPDEARYTAFRAAGDHHLVGRGMGLPDCILASGKPGWIVTLADEEPLSDRTRTAVEAGLRSGFGFPVLVEEQVIGVLEFFSLHTVQPDEEFLTMMVHIGSQLGQVIIRQRAEEYLQRAKTFAESANRAKSAFLTTMSHEIRTPMNAILGMAGMLSESPLDAKQREYVRIFQKAGANLLDLINDLLDFSKVESGQVKLESIGFDLKHLLRNMIEIMAPKARDRGLQLLLEVHPDAPLGLVGDPNRLRQILLNLVGNALKFTERGSVTLRVEPAPGATVGWLRFNVVDTGIGIAANKTAMIFERFTQADSSTTRKYGGTGLGLAISRSLATLMGGRIGCTSEEGKGSTFFVIAPFGTWDKAAIEKLVEPAAAVRSLLKPPAREVPYRILIAEDSEYNLLLLKAYLDDSGFDLDVAENGRIAVDKATSGNPDLVLPDLILMDMQMPVMDGLEATRAIRQWEASNGSRPIPILALTAHAADEALAKSMDAGCTEHLTKPIAKATLLDAISRHIGGIILVTPPKGIEKLVPGYLANVRREMTQILAGVDSKDSETVTRLGHQFKGSGNGYGFPEITRAGAAVESAAKNSDEAEIRSQILALSRYLDRVQVVV